MIRDLQFIYEDYYGCTKCPLYRLRSQMTEPFGNKNAKWFFVVSPPDEEADSLDSDGRALTGHRLRKFVDLVGRAGIDMSDVRVSPVTLCLPQTSSGDDRPPTDRELRNCMPRMREEILAVDPTILVLVGAQAVRPFWTGQKAKITKIANTFREIDVTSGRFSARFPTLILRSLDAFLTQDPDWSPNGLGRKAIDSLQVALRFVQFLEDIRNNPDNALSLRYSMPELIYQQKLDNF